MAIKKSQIRYIADGDSRNYPAGITAAMLTSGAMFDNTIRITDLQISGKYNIAFYLNDTTEPVRIMPKQEGVLLDKEQVQVWSLSEAQKSWDASILRKENITIYSVRIDANSLKDFLAWNNTFSEGAKSFLFIDYTYDAM